MSGDLGGQPMAGAEPFSAAGGPDGVLLVHGITGTPSSLRGLAVAFASAGLAVEVPLLPGHGTSVEDMIPTGWEDWSQAAELAYTELQSRCRRVLVGGLSMGGTIGCWLTARHPEIAGLIVVNPFVEPPAESYRAILRGLVEGGSTVAPAIGSDIADPSVAEVAYDAIPLVPTLSLFEGMDGLVALLGEIRCPVLIVTSRTDHVVPPVSSDILAELVSGPVERLFLERSYHVATLDYDRAEIEARAVEFARRLTGS